MVAGAEEGQEREILQSYVDSWRKPPRAPPGLALEGAPELAALGACPRPDARRPGGDEDWMNLGATVKRAPLGIQARAQSAPRAAGVRLEPRSAAPPPAGPLAGGLSLFGILGLLYGPLIAALFLTLTDLYLTEYKQRIVGPARD